VLDERLKGELIKVGLDAKEAEFYLAALHMTRPSVAEVAELAAISRTNGYDLAKRLMRRGLLTLTEVGPTGKPGGRGRSVIDLGDPAVLQEDLAGRKKILDGLVPELRAMRDRGGRRPRVRYLEGAGGMRAAMFETLEWDCPLRGILSMKDLMQVPGEHVMDEYIDARRERGVSLRVVRSPEKETDQFWPTSAHDLREVRFAPQPWVFTLTVWIGEEAVVTMAPREENFAMVVESAEFARTQTNLFEALWSASTPQPAQRNSSSNARSRR